MKKRVNSLHKKIIWYLPAFFLILMPLAAYIAFKNYFHNQIFPGVKVGGTDFGKKTIQEVEKYWQTKNSFFEDFNVTFLAADKVATLSGKTLNLGYDTHLCTQQAFLVGRSRHFFSNIYQVWQAKNGLIDLPPMARYDTNVLEKTLDSLSEQIDIPAQEALFKFENGRVTAFKPSSSGRKLNKEGAKEIFVEKIPFYLLNQEKNVVFQLEVNPVEPKVKTEEANDLGIKELLAKGYSKFLGSISSRIHNISLAASRLNGILVVPGEVFSFNEALGDVSAATGYQQAYIIKEKRTVLGDGGGVCQVSTTLFRAILNAGLPVVERAAHAYRVGYYEQDSPPGFDATVYSPRPDLKFKNDTLSHILIQSIINLNKSTLTFELYGTKDGREVKITNPQITAQISPPPPLYIDDPTLKRGQEKQIDWAAWGATVIFNRKVTRNGEILVDESYKSTYQPWQTVYLRGIAD